ncbi:fam-a protein [Plasmodium chabaudi chabaudi]|uniref:Fam-a protein n=1 Tax=Plasmodium chabaudi chabaudi TaxID=31271 RepID=A0A1D3L8H5_PLACU|nr:fam-a protein [Plasmodium chabaudi chabaudi]
MNKFYIQIVLFILSIFVYANNEALATEPDPGKDTKTKSKKCYPTSEEVYETNKHLLCDNHEETKEAEKLMNEAVKHLEYHATSKDGYKLYGKSCSRRALLYKKKHKDHTDVEKITYRKDDPNKYNKTINKIWDPDTGNCLYKGLDKIKIARVYNPNLVIIQKRYKNWRFGRQRYFYALAKKVQISEDRTIIAMTSANIIDHNSSEKEYKNKIIESANLFTTEVDSEDDIKNGKLKKTFLNIGGYLIEKKDKYVDITYIESVDGNTIF